MDDFIIVNGERYPARVMLTRDDWIYLAEILVEMTYDEAKSVFTDNATLVIDYGEDTKELTDYRLLYEIVDKLDGTMLIAYKKMTDLEKLIELHYGGVNNEGSI